MLKAERKGTNQVLKSLVNVNECWRGRLAKPQKRKGRKPEAGLKNWLFITELIQSSQNEFAGRGRQERKEQMKSVSLSWLLLWAPVTQSILGDPPRNHVECLSERNQSSDRWVRS